MYSTISTPAITDLYMPKDPVNDKDSTKLIDDLALTLLRDNDNKTYYYNGIFENAISKNDVRTNENLKKLHDWQQLIKDK